MKNFTLLVSLLMLTLGLSHSGFAFTGDDCGCSNNVIKNGSFENSLDDWGKYTDPKIDKDTKFSTSSDYNVCGSKIGLIDGYGALYQGKSVTPGQEVTLKAWGGTHSNAKSHYFRLVFYNGNTELSAGKQEVYMGNIVKDNNNRLKEYSLKATAPANATTVLFIAWSNGGYFKVDGVCVNISTPKPPADCCSDENNKLTDGSFEKGSSSWGREKVFRNQGDVNFYTNNEYVQCGSKNGIMNGPGKVYQDIAIAGGSTVTVKAYGGTHNTGVAHAFKLVFYNGNTELSENQASTNMDYKVSNSTLKQFTVTGRAPANATKVRFIIYSEGDWFKVDAACMSITTPPADCCSDESNKLTDGSFEKGSSSWGREKVFRNQGDVNFYTNNEYVQCGSKNGIMNGPGKVYQDIAIAGGSTVTVKAYGGTHNTGVAHAFKLVFYNGNTELSENQASTNMDYKVSNSTLKQFTVTGQAPANATKVRFIIYSEGDWFKVDAACMSVTPPPVATCTACADNQTVVKNPSFESGTANWSISEGTKFYSIDYNSIACGNKVGKIDGKGLVFQSINVVPGTQVVASIWGAVENPEQEQKFYLVYLNGTNIIGSDQRSAEVDQNVIAGLKQYNFSSTAPVGATSVVIAAESKGDKKFYFDAVCITVTPPSQCEECSQNRLTNGGFENGIDGWGSTGNVSASPDAKNCGTNGLKVDGAGSFWQEIAFEAAWGKDFTLNFWAAKRAAGDHKLNISFYDSNNKLLGSFDKIITKIFGNAPEGLEKYTLIGSVPETTVKVVVTGTSSASILNIDQVCLTFSGPPLPVTLASFEVTKEGSTALLRWTTSEETNSDHFDVQHSADGKNWTVLETKKAQGESRGEVNYSYTHTSPFATNLYRLKMVDFDGTFAYSKIHSLRFDGDVQLSIYPNPTANHIKFDSKVKVDNVKLYNQAGVLVLDTKPSLENEVDLSRVIAGIYYVKINNGAGTRKLVVVK